MVIGLALWFAPVVAVASRRLRPDSVFVDQGLFFSGAAVVTFGGAYAVLAYVAQQAVDVYGWLTPGEMVRGLALAETTPGPLIMVVQFVAFVGAYRDPGSLDPWVAAVLASLLTTWVTFVPCFLFILLGAPYVERLRHNTHLAAALTGITAAVVGVIANLAAFFALHTLFDETRHVSAGILQLDVPVLASADPVAFVITAVALSSCSGEAGAPFARSGCAPCWASPPRCRSSCDRASGRADRRDQRVELRVVDVGGEHRGRLGVPADRPRQPRGAWPGP